MTKSERAEQILRKMKAEEHRRARFHKPYDGPPDLSFISKATKWEQQSVGPDLLKEGKHSRKAKAILKKLSRPEHRNRMLQDFNGDNLDQISRVSGGGKSEDKFLKEMNSLEDEYQQHIEAIGPKVSVY